MHHSYSICIRPADGFCCVQYSVCADQMDAFSLDAKLQMAKQDTDCSADFIVISGEAENITKDGGLFE